MSIVVLGSINRDIVASVERLPDPGETIRATKHAMYPGGKGANQAVAAACSGADVVLIGRIGRDGVDLLDEIASAGVDVSPVTVADGTSGTALITVAADGSNTIVTTGGVNHDVGAAELDTLRSALASAQMLMLQLEVRAEVVVEAIDLASAAGVPVMLDPAPVRDLDPAIYPKVAWITPNEHEAMALSGSTDPSWFHGRGTTHAVVTLGTVGCAYTGPQGSFVVAAPTVDVVDTVACGDAFNGALAAALVRTNAVRDALDLACAAGARAASVEGAYPSLVVLRG
ncbi:MAG: ribokinase [Actinomycetota bacterium]